MQLLEALKLIRERTEDDPLVSDIWTANGDVRVEAVGAIMDATVSRADIVSAAPKFSRQNMELPGDEPVQGSNENSSAPTPPLEGPPPLSGDEADDAPGFVPASPEGGAPASPPTGYTLGDFIEQGEMDSVQFQNFVRNMHPEDLRELRSLYEDEEEAVARGREELAMHGQEVKQRKGMVKALLSMRDPDMNNQQAIRAVLDRAAEERAHRAGVSAAIKKQIGPRASLDPRSVLDRAYARKNSRGGQRTVHPFKGINK